MPTKIRLQRFGKKGRPYYHVVIADSRAPRDGKYIEKIGIYNPNTNPALIELDNDRALNWLQTGAVPTNTVNAILKYTGVVYKNHLLKGVAKGAFSEEEAEKRYQAWVNEKAAKIQAKRDGLSANAAAEAKKILANEMEINKLRAKEIAAARIAESEASQVAEVSGAAEAKADLAEAVEETVAEVAEAVQETVAQVEEVVEEVAAKVEEVVEDVVEEVKAAVEETPAAEETPAKEESEDSEEKKD
jgi:small subunit ribosomal protein S16